MSDLSAVCTTSRSIHRIRFPQRCGRLLADRFKVPQSDGRSGMRHRMEAQCHRRLSLHMVCISSRQRASTMRRTTLSPSLLCTAAQLMGTGGMHRLRQRRVDPSPHSITSASYLTCLSMATGLSCLAMAIVHFHSSIAQVEVVVGIA